MKPALIQVAQARCAAAKRLHDAVIHAGSVTIQPEPSGIPEGCAEQGLWMKCQRTADEVLIDRLVMALKAEIADMLEDSKVRQTAERLFKAMTGSDALEH